MNPMTGEIVADLSTLDPEQQKQFRKIKDEAAADEARKLLNGRTRAMVDISGESRLAAEARSMRASGWDTEKPTGKAAHRRLRQIAKAQP